MHETVKYENQHSNAN